MIEFLESITSESYSTDGLLKLWKDNSVLLLEVRRLPGRKALVVVFIKNMLFEIIAFVVFECL